ncbi:hypothetical protein B0H19DRAFT_919891 [Mycena capillaripes]|nr:hypothetical protein B0H19DRAFT_919891 [Mycena capillaripes]
MIRFISSIEDLRKGTIKTRKNKAATPYTILLVGETGVGKSSVLEFIANVMVGNPAFKYDFSLLNHENEAGGSQAGSQTNAAHLYKLESNNGQEVHILDTPGLADTRGLQQDEIHKKSIATQIRKHIESVHAVIILANGTVPRLTVGTDYALSTLSAIFPKSLAGNIAFMFTNIADVLSGNFSQDSVPDELRDAPQFFLNNPIALQRKYDDLKKNPHPKAKINKARNVVSNGEEEGLEMLVDVFDWLDGLTPQPTTEMLSLYNQSQQIDHQIANTLAQMDQASAKKEEIRKLMNDIRAGKASMDAYSKFEQTVNLKPWKQVESAAYNTLCSESGCYSNCYEGSSLTRTSYFLWLVGCVGMGSWTCSRCNHSFWKHNRYCVLWTQVPETHITIDGDMKQKWEKASEGKERNEVMLVQMRKTLIDLTNSIDDSTATLFQLASDYANLSLSGSFSAQVEKAINLLEQKLESMRQKGEDQESLQKIEASLNTMRKKLDVLKKANAKAKKETTKIVAIAKKGAAEAIKIVAKAATAMGSDIIQSLSYPCAGTAPEYTHPRLLT